MLNGAKYRIKDQNVYMPPFGPAYSDAELAGKGHQELSCSNLKHTSSCS